MHGWIGKKRLNSSGKPARISHVVKTATLGQTMDIPLELSFHNLEPSDALKQAVQAHVAKLEQFHDHIIGCREVNEITNKSAKATGNPPDVHIVIRNPN